MSFQRRRCYNVQTATLNEFQWCNLGMPLPTGYILVTPVLNHGLCYSLSLHWFACTGYVLACIKTMVYKFQLHGSTQHTKP